MSAGEMAVDDGELVVRAKAGDVPAFEELYRRYNARIYHFARQVVRTADDAQDAAQETFVRAWNALPGLREPATFRVWLHRIALNACRDAGKRRGRETAQEISEDTIGSDSSDRSDPSDGLMTAETQRAVRQAIKGLGPEHRLVVTMHHLEGMDVSSIAEILGVSQGTVMSRLARAREGLRRKLSAYVEM